MKIYLSQMKVVISVAFLQVEKYINDPLNWHQGMKARWALSAMNAMDKINFHMAENKWPFVVLHGDADQLTMIEGSRMLHGRSNSNVKSIVVGIVLKHQ